jgi:epoxyqueuosine reductase QueG
MQNQCEFCTLCVDKCPQKALTAVSFEDHPEHREDVLNVETCKGDYGCKVCIVVCPWAQQHLKRSKNELGYLFRLPCQ